VLRAFFLFMYIYFMKRSALFTFILLVVASWQTQAQHYISIDTPGQLQQFFTRTPNRLPLVSAHRGGPAPGFPENCIETFENTLRHTYAIIEFDPQLTKDSVAVVMHDYTLNRTSNGTGTLSDYTYAELLQLRLKDNEGNLTDFKIPTLQEVLEWARNKTILTVDIKKNISPAVIERIIRENRAEAYAVVITYSIEQAKEYHRLNPNLMISTTIRNREEFERVREAGIPFKNVVAFVGISEPDAELYQLLHEQGVYCILGTMGNLDKSAAARKSNVYARLIENGADVLATDRPVEAAAAIKELVPAKSPQAPYLKMPAKKKQPARQRHQKNKALKQNPAH
jgi:glycerophosphoryl diester phosphodiesterase